MLSQNIKTSGFLSDLLIYANKSVTPISIVIFVVYFTPFTMGEFIPVVSSFYYQITWILISILFLFNYRTILNHKRVFRTNYFIPTILFASSFFVSMFMGEGYSDLTEYTKYDSTFGGVLKDVIMFVPMQLLLIYFIYLSIQTKNDLKKVIYSFLKIGAVVNFIGLSIFFIYKGTEVRGLEGRLGATFTDPNYLGRFEILLIIISLSAIVIIKDKRYLLLNLANISISTFILFLTFSRSAIITLMLSIVIILLTLKNRLIKTSIILLVCIFSIILLLYVGTKRTSDDVIAGQSSAPTGTVDYSSTTRIALNYAAVLMFLDYPVFGVGYHNFYNIYINRSYLPVDIPLASHISVVHSWLFSVLAEQGMFGLIVFLYILFLVFRKLFHKYRRADDEEMKFYGLVLFCMFFVLIFNGLFFPVFFTELLFSLLLGIISAYFRISKNLKIESRE